MNSILEKIYNNYLKHPKKIAIVTKDKKINYYQLWENICKHASLLKKQNISVGEIVILENSQDEKFCYLFFALNMIKAVTLTIDKDTPINRIEKIKSNIGARYVICVKDILENIDDIEPYSDYDFNYEGDCVILLSSGSTGEEKNIIYTYDTIYNIVDVYEDIYNLTSDLTVLITGPLCRAYGFTRLLVTFYYDLTLFIYNSLNIIDLIDIINNNKDIMICTNPTILHYLVNVFSSNFKECINNIRIIESCTAPLNQEDALKIKNMIDKTKFYNFYGSTELQIAYLDISKYGFEKGCVGKTLDDTYIEILDNNGNVIDSNRNKPGIVRCYNKKYMFKYHNMENIKYFYPGEVGFIENGFLYLVDRKKSFFNVNGFKISPVEVENVALKCNGVLECVCFYDGVLTLNIIVNDKYDLKQLKKILRNDLANYQIPKKIEIVKEIHKTPNGKVDRKKYL